MTTFIQHRKSGVYSFFIALIALVLSACNPTAEFTYSPDTVVAGEVVTFDASLSKAYKPEQNNKIESYAWNFGDGNTAKGKVVKHTFTKVGDYHVELTVTDSIGEIDVSLKKVTVTKADVDINTDAIVNVESNQGALLAGADVEIKGVQATTNNNGQAKLVLANVDKKAEYVVTAKAEGFVTQSITVKAAELNNVRLTLLAEKFNTAIQDISVKQTITTNILGASVSIPDNAFVTKTGTAASGKAKVVITPWDISNADSSAFLGNAQAMDAEGNAAELISAGMITVDFYAENGEKLQLAEGKTAQIRMLAPNNSINNQALTETTKIPMWTFDESKGKWIEEGEGSVSIENGTVYVVADVSHFSTWNWDFKFTASGSINVQCVDSANAGVACQVNALVTLADGSTFTKFSRLTAAGTKIINMPTEASVTWSAKTNNGLLGSKVAKISDGDVKIIIADPTTRNFVVCQRPDGTKKGCVVKATATLQDGSQVDMGKYTILAAGSTILSSVENVQSIAWQGTSHQEYNAAKEVIDYSGTATSGLTDDVTIILDTETNYGKADSFTVTCNKQTSGAVVTQISNCDLTVTVFEQGTTSQKILFNGKVATGQPVLIDVSSLNLVTNTYSLRVRANNTSLINGNNLLFFASKYYDVGNGVTLKKIPNTELTLSKCREFSDGICFDGGPVIALR